MVGHQHVSVNEATAVFRVLFQPVEIQSIVFIGKEARLAIIAALNQMERHSRKGDTWPSWHMVILHDLQLAADYVTKKSVVCPLSVPSPSTGCGNHYSF